MDGSESIRGKLVDLDSVEFEQELAEKDELDDIDDADGAVAMPS